MKAPHRWLIWTAATLVAASAWAGEHPRVIELKNYIAGLRTLEATVNGRTGRFIFDTAGGLSLITPEFRAAIGAQAFGRVTAFRHTGEVAAFRRVRVSAVELAGVPLATGELAEYDLMRLLEGAPRVQGLVGLDVFQDAALTIDFAHERLVLESDDSLRKRVRTMHPLRLRLSRQGGGAALDVFVAVDAPRGPLWLELDSGNAGPVILAPHAVAELGTAGGADSTATLRLAPGLEFAGPVVTKDIIYDGLLNAAFFQHHVVTLDLRTGRAWAAPIDAAR